MVTLAPHADYSGDWLVLETILRNYPSPEAKTLEFRDCGVFESKVRAARQAQNPKTMDKVHVPAKRTVKFKVGRVMKMRLHETPLAIDEATGLAIEAAAASASTGRNTSNQRSE